MFPSYHPCAGRQAWCEASRRWIDLHELERSGCDLGSAAEEAAAAAEAVAAVAEAAEAVEVAGGLLGLTLTLTLDLAPTLTLTPFPPYTEH